MSFRLVLNLSFVLLLPGFVVRLSHRLYFLTLLRRHEGVVTVADCKTPVALDASLFVLLLQFGDDHGLTLVRQTRPLSVNVFVVAVADHLARGKLQLATRQNFDGLDVEFGECLCTCLTLLLALHNSIQLGETGLGLISYGTV